ncbi:ParB/RepB/Spo0J family partition protein (plasmid) [Lichenicola cladoniae]|uniref:ParB/RepB/Spo0J family partition protein n=1 Tax=Lichenicola cladoniae TaxID=1484109 RepID=A0A6M8HX97_9PROT|nr:ParB/RepB/Spo0J family partition protein [Lichenicola cladoniae]NPD66292.1 ParB/RepB/Spo0J family partition protein [Acetobacteraceae bacterium]QKE93174.1 ParB/RepB/Spo0J family partition protein [Lichenicola cladoniae]
MELRTVDPRKLKANPNNPRRSSAGEFLDAQMAASIKSIGLVQPPLVKEDGKKLIIIAGHRRVAGCIAAGLPEIQVLVQPEADTTIDPMRAVSENLVRAEMGQVDRWRSMEALSAAGWNDAAIAEALGMSPRNIAQARLLANICPAMLDQMAKNDLPDQRELRVIASATKEEQTEVWKRFKPKRGHEASWGEITHALSKVRLPAKNAKFGEAEAQAFGILWEEDLFAPADEDSRSTTQVDAFLAAQTAWLEANLGEGDCIIEMDEYYRPKLPRGAQQHYGRAGDGVFTAHYIEARSGIIRETHYTMPASRTGSSGQAADNEPVRKPRPDLTAKGAAMVGDLRTDALHQALREQPVDDDQLIAMLVMALAGRNVTVLSGVTGRHRASHLAVLAETLTEGGVLTRDLTTIRHAARETLVEVLSCRENHSASGMVARYAGTAIDADVFLPNMATEEFLPALSRGALEKCAVANDIAPQGRVKDTRAAVVARFASGTFIYPDARFAPTAAELEARRNPASLIGGDDEADVLEDGETAEGLEMAEHDPDDARAGPDDANDEGGEIDGSLAAATLDEAAYAERTAHAG